MKKLTTLLIAAVIVALVGGVCLWLFVFRKVDHKITINLDGGVVVFSDNTKSELTEKLYQSSNEDQKIELGVAFEKLGYTFSDVEIEAETSKNLEKLPTLEKEEGYYINIPAKFDNDFSIKFIYTANSYNVTLVNGENSSNVLVSFNTNIADQAVAPKTGHTFKGYFTELNGQGVKYIGEDGKGCKAWDIAEDKTLYAYYAANEYSITLNAGENTKAKGTETAKVTYQSTLPTIILPTKTGYKFLGYFTDQNGAGVKYYNEQGQSQIEKFIQTNDLTLYANWSIITYNVQLIDGDDITNTQLEYNQSLPTLSNKTGFEFAGWCLESDAETIFTTCPAIDDETQTIKLYSKFTPKTYNVTLNSQGANTAGTESVIASYNELLPSITIPAKTNYDFVGYFTQANGEGVKYIGADGVGIKAWDFDEAKTLYAHFTLTNYNIIYDLGGGTNNNSNPNTYTIDSADIVFGEPTRTGYEFSGWTAANISNPTKTLTLKHGTSGDIELTANWTANTYSITLKDESDNVLSTIQVTYDQKVPNLNSYLIKSKLGHVFDGYYVFITNTPVVQIFDGQGEVCKNVAGVLVGQYTDEDGNWKWTNSINVKLNFVKEKYTIHFNSNGGSPCEDMLVEFGESVVFPTTEQVGLIDNTIEFKYWALGIDGPPVNYSYGMPDIGNDGDEITLYAKWGEK